jgi:transposase
MYIRVFIMANYRSDNYQQNCFVAVNLEEQLVPGTFEHALHYLVEHYLDLSDFDADYNNDDAGRPAYHPGVLLRIVLFAYSKGIFTSRKIAWHCQRNITFMALACHEVPHWTTIANFVSSHPDAITGLFERVLLVCDQQGLIGNELIAIDGCKMPSNASKSHSGTFSELDKKRTKIRARLEHALAEHQRFDATEDNDAADRASQRADTLRAAAERIDEFLETESPRMGQGKKPKEVKSNITDNESATMKTSHGVIQGYNGVNAVDRKHQVIVSAEIYGAGPEQQTLIPMLNGIQNSFNRLGIADDILGSELIVTADTGFANEENMQYCHDNDINAYIPDNQFRSRDPRFEDHLKAPSRQRAKKHKPTFPASAFQYDPIAMTCQCPGDKLLQVKKLGLDPKGNQKTFFEGRLTDCRACPKKHLCMRNPASADDRTGHGRQVSFITEKKTSYTEWMRHRIDTDEGRAIYSHRMHVVEPVFANIESNKGLNRFTLRTKQKVKSQWQLYSLVHNIEKLQRYGQIAA